MSNTIIHNSAKKSTGKFSLSPIAPEIAPDGTLKITSDDVTLKAPKIEAEAKTENVLDEDIPIRKEPTLAELRAERVGKFSDAEKSYVSMEDFANSESPIWRNVDYNDHDTKSTIMQDTHNTMVSEGSQIYNWGIKKMQPWTVLDAVYITVFPTVSHQMHRRKHPWVMCNLSILTHHTVPHQMSLIIVYPFQVKMSIARQKSPQDAKNSTTMLKQKPKPKTFLTTIFP